MQTVYKVTCNLPEYVAEFSTYREAVEYVDYLHRIGCEYIKIEPITEIDGYYDYYRTTGVYVE